MLPREKSYQLLLKSKRYQQAHQRKDPHKQSDLLQIPNLPN